MLYLEKRKKVNLNVHGQINSEKEEEACVKDAAYHLSCSICIENG